MSKDIEIKKVFLPPAVYYRRGRSGKFRRACEREKTLIFELRPELLTDEYLRTIVISEKDFNKTGITI